MPGEPIRVRVRVRLTLFLTLTLTLTLTPTQGEPEKLERNGYVMRLGGGAGTIRPRAAPPPAPPPVTKERLEAAAKLRASKSSSNLSVHKAQKKALRLEYQPLTNP